MALTLNANFIKAAQSATPRARILARVYLTNANPFRYTTGSCDQMDYPESLHRVTPITRGLDFKGLKTNTSGASLEFVRDASWESHLGVYGIKGAAIWLYVGFAELAEGDFERLATFQVEKVTTTDTTVTLGCTTIEKKFRDNPVYYQFVGLHPLQIARRLLFLAGVPNSQVDLTALDPSTYTTSISHFVCSRFHGGGAGSYGGSAGAALTNALTGPKPIGELLDGLGQIAGGWFHDDENGDITFTRFDASLAASDNWTEDDITNLRIGPLYENLVNRVRVNSEPYSFGESIEVSGFQVSFTDVNSVSDFKIIEPGGAGVGNVKELTFNTDWASGASQLFTTFTASTPANGGTFTIRGWSPYSFCGTAWTDIAHFPSGDEFVSTSDYGNGSQDTDFQVTSSRPLYVRIDNETIKCTAVSVIEDAGVWVCRGGRESNYNVPIPYGLRLTIDATNGRGYSGTAAAHQGLDTGSPRPAVVRDVTMQQYIAETFVTRFKNGGQVIQCTTGLDKYAYQLGDFVTLEIGAARYRSKGRAGLGSTTKFQITEKAVDLFADPPAINWTLVEASWSGAAALSTTDETLDRTPEIYFGGVNAAMNSDVGHPHVQSGLTVSGTSGFDVTFTSGVASSLNGRAESFDSTTFTVTASRDAYFAIDTVSGAIIKYETTNGGAVPTKSPQDAWIAKVVTDGVGITSTDETIRITTAVDGNRLDESTVSAKEMRGDTLGGRQLNLNSAFTMRE